MPQTVQSHPRSSEKKVEISAAAENKIAFEPSLHAGLISMIKHINTSFDMGGPAASNDIKSYLQH